MLGRIEVQASDVLKFFNEMCIIGKFERPDPMRLESMGHGAATSSTLVFLAHDVEIGLIPLLSTRSSYDEFTRSSDTPRFP